MRQLLPTLGKQHMCVHLNLPMQHAGMEDRTQQISDQPLIVNDDFAMQWLATHMNHQDRRLFAHAQKTEQV